MKFMTVKKKVHDIPKGQFTSILWERPAKVHKGCKDTIVKRVRATARIGINYENMASTQVKRSNGKFASGLAWGEWEDYPYFIKHTPKDGDLTHYLRAYLGKGSNVTTEWFLNGRKVPREVIEPMVLTSELKNEPITEEKPIILKTSDILAID